MRHAAALTIALALAPGVTPHASGEELRDPTRPPTPVITGKHAEERKPLVSAVFLSNTRRIAIFNAQPVRAGDTVGIYHIDEVEAHGVRYSASGHSEFAPLAGVR
jgi:hypothetical protein